MSASMLQRVVVRMLFDPGFRERVYADPEAALHDVPLTTAERQWVVTPPSQAYGTDPYRQSRALSGLCEEYPVASALAVRCPQGLACLQRFFASTAFHDCVQQRGSMAAAFGSYLQSAAFADAPTVAWMALVEMGGVRVRRAPPRPPGPASPCTPETRLQVAPWVALLAVPPPTLSRYSQLLKRLQQRGPVLLDSILDTTYRLPAGPRMQGAASAWILVVRDAAGDGFSLEAASPELGALLAAAPSAIPCEALCALAVRLGAAVPEAMDIIAGFVADQLLIQAP